MRCVYDNGESAPDVVPPEVKAELQVEKIEAHRVNYKAALASDPDLEALRAARSAKQEEIEVKSREISKWRDAYIAEAEGTAGTGLVGKRSVYNEKRLITNRPCTSAEQLQDQFKGLEAQPSNQERRFQGMLDAANLTAGLPGYLANHKALMRVLWREKTGIALYAAIMLALLILDTNALLSKTGRLSVHDTIASESVETAVKLAQTQGLLARTVIDKCVEVDDHAGAESVPEQWRALKGTMLQHAEREVRAHLANMSPRAAKVPDAEPMFSRVTVAHPVLGVVIAECLHSATLNELAASMAILMPEIRQVAESMMSGEYEAFNAHDTPIQIDVPLLPQIAPSLRVQLRPLAQAA